LNCSNGTWGRSLTETVSLPVAGSGWTEATILALMPNPAATMKSRYWLPGVGSPMKSDPVRGPARAGVSMSNLPIFERLGHSAGASLPKFASSSVQAVCPSAASGLIESPSGRSTSAERIVDGVGDLLSS
jgi:hypothetical protein